MQRAILAGCAYFGCVFAAGFALGVVRTLFAAPLLGETFAVALELPIVLAIAWIVCGWLTGRFAIPARTLPRVVMGGIAFLLLMAGEASISLSLAGRSLAEHVQLYAQAPHILGLAGQIAFAVFPVVQIWTADRQARSGR